MRNKIRTAVTDTYRGSKRNATRYRDLRHTKSEGVDAQDIENLPRQEGMRRPYRRKHVAHQKNINYTVVERLLKGNIGKKWDDVYGEFRQNLDKRGTMDDMAIRYIKVLVLQPFAHAGRVHADFTDHYVGFYVDKKGVLQYRKAAKIKRADRDVLKIHTRYDGAEIAPYNGQWCEIMRAKLKRAHETETNKDVPLQMAEGFELTLTRRYGPIFEPKVFFLAPDDAHDAINFIKTLRPLSQHETDQMGLPDIS